MRLQEFIVKIRRRESPFYRALYQTGKRLMRMDVPIPPSILHSLHTLDSGRKQTWDQLALALYYRPLLRSLCTSCGKNLLLERPILPHISGDLRLHVGDDCCFCGSGVFMANKLFDDPTIIIGDRTYVGFGLLARVAKKISIGSEVLISDGCSISDNPGHRIAADQRIDHPPEPSQVKPVVIEDQTWLGARSIIMPGVTIGRGSVVGAGSVVTKDVPPDCLAVGNPAKVVRTNING